MNEIWTAITDFALAGLCIFFAWRLWSVPVERPAIRNSFIGLYLATGLAALLGGIAHGWMADRAHALFPLVSICVLGSIGIASYNLWRIICHMVLSGPILNYFKNILRVFLIFYLAVILFGTRSFMLAVIVYVPPTLVLTSILLLRAWRQREKFVIFGLIGLALTLVAAYVQQARIAIDPNVFDHNALYHLIQAVALWFVYKFGSRLARWRL